MKTFDDWAKVWFDPFGERKPRLNLRPTLCIRACINLHRQAHDD